MLKIGNPRNQHFKAIAAKDLVRFFSEPAAIASYSLAETRLRPASGYLIDR
jgi:hypothetical protein